MCIRKNCTVAGTDDEIKSLKESILRKNLITSDTATPSYGTYVNGNVLRKKTALASGNMITIGRLTLKAQILVLILMTVN